MASHEKEAARFEKKRAERIQKLKVAYHVSYEKDTHPWGLWSADSVVIVEQAVYEQCLRGLDAWRPKPMGERANMLVSTHWLFGGRPRRVGVELRLVTETMRRFSATVSDPQERVNPFGLWSLQDLWGVLKTCHEELSLELVAENRQEEMKQIIFSASFERVSIPKK